MGGSFGLLFVVFLCFDAALSLGGGTESGTGTLLIFNLCHAGILSYAFIHTVPKSGEYPVCVWRHSHLRAIGNRVHRVKGHYTQGVELIDSVSTSSGRKLAQVVPRGHGKPLYKLEGYVCLQGFLMWH